ncbi:hypothetical protein LC613_10530 [Nostoc sphaeroides CHAB 2801]|uniref:Uncharacterized protein n=1 Tax=Nostoc sphaeroides CCNUC1 TaxID=2653204 RepID=A0A5P8VTR7_9NOSO|nr:hypothetical protein [Nostoc sphaeroides]MCC5628515.1 hypothetical protein [Nostoc sphaeroides CHAB 2801]QFS43803.1 hypothetical protein GXM_01276 [Nostoc sphaeroides CCNUC1]
MESFRVIIDSPQDKRVIIDSPQDKIVETLDFSLISMGECQRLRLPQDL